MIPYEKNDSTQVSSEIAYLFLDFDGVLHPGLAGTFCYLNKLEDILRSLPHVVVVLSTTWRLDNDFDQLLTIFSPDIRDRIVGATPYLENENREDEIHLWLRKNGISRYTKWIAVDDDVSLFSPSFKALVLCDTARGLREPQLIQITNALK